MSDDISRRNLLRNGGAGLLAIGTAGMAGCLDDVPVVGDVASSASGPSAEEWLANLQFDAVHDEDEMEEQVTGFGTEDVEIDDHEEPEFEFSYVVPQAVFDNEEELLVYWPLEQGEGQRNRVGVPATEVDWQIQQETEWEWEYTYTQETVGGTHENTDTGRTTLEVNVLAGEFVLDDVEDALEEWAEDRYDEDLSSEGEYDGFDLYEVDDMGFALRDDYLLEVSADQYVEFLAALEATIDARFDADGRWTDDEDAGGLLDHYASGHLVDGEIHEPLDEEDGFGAEEWEDGLVGSVTSYEFGGDTTELTEVYLYEEERDADADALLEHVESNRDIRDQWASLEDYDVTDEGRVLILSGTVRTRALFA